MKNKIKIGINGFFINKPNTGIGKYTRDIILDAVLKSTSLDFTLFVNEPFDNSFKLPKNIKIKHIPFVKFGTAGLKKTIWEQISLPKLAKKLNVNAFISPYPSQPWFKRWYKNNIYTISVIHDCIPWKYKSYRRSLMSKLYHYNTLKSAKLCNEVWTVSNTSKNEISKICNIKKSKINVFYNCVSKEYLKKYSKSEKDKVLSKFGIKDDQFILYVGGYDSRKNVSNLIKGYLDFKKSTEFKHKLVLAGGKILNDSLYSDFNLKNSENIVKTGFISNKELAILYQSASIFISISKDEGFNIPSIEALFSNCKIILSDIKVHREIIGKSAKFINIENNITKNIKDTLTESFNRKNLKHNYKHKEELMIKYDCNKMSDLISKRLIKLIK